MRVVAASLVTLGLAAGEAATNLRSGWGAGREAQPSKLLEELRPLRSKLTEQQQRRAALVETLRKTEESCRLRGVVLERQESKCRQLFKDRAADREKKQALRSKRAAEEAKTACWKRATLVSWQLDIVDRAVEAVDHVRDVLPILQEVSVAQENALLRWEAAMGSGQKAAGACPVEQLSAAPFEDRDAAELSAWIYRPEGVRIPPSVVSKDREVTLATATTGEALRGKGKVVQWAMVDGARAIYVAFRGTDVLGDWAVNLASRGKALHGVTVHGGMLEALRRPVGAPSRSTLEDLQDKLQMWLRGKPGRRVVLCGHSLGGGYATLAALELSKWKPSLDLRVVSFGAPQVVKPAPEAAPWTTLRARATQYVNAWDLVPRLSALLPVTDARKYDAVGSVMVVGKDHVGRRCPLQSPRGTREALANPQGYRDERAYAMGQASAMERYATACHSMDRYVGLLTRRGA